MHYDDAVQLCAAVLSANPVQTIMLWGPPGCGKSHAATIGLPAALNLPPEAVSMFRPSLRDPVDVGGLPMRDNFEGVDVTSHLPIKDWVRLNFAAQRHGRALLVIDELNQSTPMMFNALNGVILDRKAGDFVLDPRINIVCTGNRQEDRAASNRMPSHTSNRLMHVDFDSSLDTWLRWAASQSFPLWLLAFLRFRPAMLNDFKPDQRANPTERTWEMVARSVPESLPSHLFRAAVEGLVGEAACIELVAFREFQMNLPDPRDILANPDKAPVPDYSDKGGLARLYAIGTALAHHVDTNTADAFVTYIKRLPPDFRLATVNYAKQVKPQFASTKAYRDYLVFDSNLLIN